MFERENPKNELKPFLPNDDELIQVVLEGGEDGSDIVWMTKRELRARKPKDNIIRIYIDHAKD